jgi:hypothetical protein
MAEVLVAFRGPVRAERGPPPLGLTLRGATAAAPQDETVLAFSAATAQLPEQLEDARVEALADGHYAVRAGEREWRIAARAVHLTRSVGGEFYRALPPRAVPLGKRLLWRLVLALAASRAGLALLRTLRR